MESPDFLYRELPRIGKRVHRLGLSFNHGIDAKATELALGQGVNYLFWSRFRTGDTREVVADALRRDRERYVLATGPVLGYFGGSVRRAAEKLLRLLDIEYIDVFQIFWLGRMSAFTQGVQQELVKLREEGLVRAVGVSIHDRPRAGRLAADSPLDLLMIRYNAAHPGAEKDIFPHYEKRRLITVAYTATSWRKLLRRPKRWEGEVMTPGQCYRFCLSSPHVNVALTGPANESQLKDNLSALEDGPLSPAEEDWIREFGRVVHG